MRNSYEPLGLLHEMQSSEQSLPLNWVPCVNLLALVVGMLLLSSHWLCPPGLNLHLPVTSQGVAFANPFPVQDSLMIDREGRVFFHRKLYNAETLVELFRENFQVQCLLLKVDTQAPLELMMRVISNAYQCGCRQIQMAVNVRN